MRFENPRQACRGSRGVGIVLALSLSWFVVSAAHAEDIVVVKGDSLRGTVVDLTPAGAVFEPIHGAGSIVIPWADIESIQSSTEFGILYGDDGEAQGQLLDVLDDGNSLLIGTEGGAAQRIEPGTLFRTFRDGAVNATLMDRLRSTFRYWEASFDAGAAYNSSATETVLGTTGLRLFREKGPTRFLLEGSGRYGNQKSRGEERSVTENVVIGFLRGEYDFTDRLYGYASLRGTHDAIQHLALRGEPRAGAGAHIVRSDRFNFSADVGGAWIYEQFFGTEPIDGLPPLKRNRGRNNYWTIAFGAQADAQLPFGTIWRGRAEYLPAVDDWERDYLIRAETSLEFPLLEWLAFRVALIDEYDNTPAEGARRNRVTTTAALSLRFP
ncbi:MAG: DUF481 domain-containing protein [Myxococcota bacterium]